MNWEQILKAKCRSMGWRCKIRNRNEKLYARVLDWTRPDTIQNILATIKEDYPNAKITFGVMPSTSIFFGPLTGDITFRLNP